MSLSLEQKYSQMLDMEQKLQAIQEQSGKKRLLKEEVDEEKETFASTYEALFQEMEKLFRENWHKIREGCILPVKQAGPVTYHRMKDLDAIREKVDFDWNMKIGDFKRAYEKAMRKDENS